MRVLVVTVAAPNIPFTYPANVSLFFCFGRGNEFLKAGADSDAAAEGCGNVRQRHWHRPDRNRFERRSGQRNQVPGIPLRQMELALEIFLRNPERSLTPVCSSL